MYIDIVYVHISYFVFVCLYMLGLPKSAVLEDQDKTNNFALQMEYLYNKFIKIGSLHEINLSHELRAPLIQFFERDKLHLTQKKESFLFNLFDQCAHSILQLMFDAYHRFTVTDNYKSIIADLIDDDDENYTLSNDSDIINPNEITILRNATSYNKLLAHYTTQIDV